MLSEESFSCVQMDSQKQENMTQIKSDVCMTYRLAGTPLVFHLNDLYDN